MRTNLMLLAGRGKRFSDAGYVTPKPLIKVDGIPMFVAAAQSLPPADKLIFVVSKDYVENYNIENVICYYFPNAFIVIQTVPLQGQAHSALQAESKINPESLLTIASCDARPIYNKEKFEQEIVNPNIDALVWSFSNYPPMATQPNSYSWISTNPSGYVTKIQYKKPLSTSPIYDNAVVGWFTYKKAKNCFDSIKAMINNNLKIGLEFSIDECTNVLIENNLSIKIFEIQTFLSWGTPTELMTYEYWQKYFSLKNDK